jgi:uncharacterized SAM-dependent methyltransferase
MPVNDLIFKELVKRGYSLEGNTRVWNIADSKLWYLTPEQAQGFLDLEQGKSYKKEVIQKEIDLINTNMPEMLKEIGTKKPLNIVDLGCGDGKKAVLFIGHLKDKLKLRYCPIDISGYMVQKAIERIKALAIGEVVEFQYNISDFDNMENIASVLRNKEYSKNFYMLLGNTLGNFEINDLLYSIGNSMRDGDYILIGNGLDNRNHDEIIKSYNDPIFHTWLMKIMQQIGLDKKDVEFGVRFNNGRIELYYTLLGDKKISFQDKHIYFNKGDQIIVVVSYKYAKDEFEEFMHLYFKRVKMFTAKDKSYTIALCGK